MFLFWLLWITIVVGGFYLGGGYALSFYRGENGAAAALNAVVYIGFAVYGLPRLVRLFRRS
ncbi:MAG TPA: hypothetical protein PKM58_01395 [Pyrinomonadaceae bacterium]|nr:hypothetical protein [Pyrinomonadaceae bacterium]HNU07223.1 hypothetical protein [Pyrinomonadaceae bacterium]